MLKKTLFVLPLLGLTSCATLTPAAKLVRDAEKKSVEKCQFIGDLSSTANWSSSVNMEVARTWLRNEAAEKGATHLVWEAFGHGSYSTTTVWAKAYRCD